MTDPKACLRNLHKNLTILQEREAKYGGNGPSTGLTKSLIIKRPLP